MKIKNEHVCECVLVYALLQTSQQGFAPQTQRARNEPTTHGFPCSSRVIVLVCDACQIVTGGVNTLQKASTTAVPFVNRN